MDEGDAVTSADMVTWLKACLDEDQRVAEEMALLDESPWRADPSSDGHTWQVVDAVGDAVIHSDDDCCISRDIAHWVASHDPTRVLADITAKRETLRHHFAGPSKKKSNPFVECQWCGFSFPCFDVQNLAQTFAGRPGWSEKWAMSR